MPKCASRDCDSKVLPKTIFCGKCQLQRKALTNKDKPKDFVPRIYGSMETYAPSYSGECAYNMDTFNCNSIIKSFHPVDIPMGSSYIFYSLDGGSKTLLTRDPSPIAGYSKMLMIFRFGEQDYEFQTIVEPNLIPTLKQFGKLLVKEFFKAFQVAPIRLLLEDSLKPTLPPK